MFAVNRLRKKRLTFLSAFLSESSHRKVNRNVKVRSKRLDVGALSCLLSVHVRLVLFARCRVLLLVNSVHAFVHGLCLVFLLLLWTVLLVFLLFLLLRSSTSFLHLLCFVCVCVSVCVRWCLSVCLSACLSVRMSVCLSVSFCAGLFVVVPVATSTAAFSPTCLWFYLSIYFPLPHLFSRDAAVCVLPRLTILRRFFVFVSSESN